MIRYAETALLAILVLGFAAGCVNADDSHSKGPNTDAARPPLGADRSTHTVNGSIEINAGQKKDDVSTVNGSIRINENAIVGGARTVNGSIVVGAHASADELHTVNGAITVGDGAKVSHTISAVNGALTLRSGADVGGALTNVNGHIFLQSAHVGGGIKTVNGNMDIGNNSRVDGGILIEKEATDVFWFLHWGPTHIPRIVIGPGAAVQGNLRFERPVQLYVNESASTGPVTGATVVRFSGAHPQG